MPKLDGLTLCKRVKEHDSLMGNIPVIVYSSLISEEMVAKCKACGADRQIAKPRGEEIVGVIDDLALRVEMQRGVYRILDSISIPVA